MIIKDLFEYIKERIYLKRTRGQVVFTFEEWRRVYGSLRNKNK